MSPLNYMPSFNLMKLLCHIETPYYKSGRKTSISIIIKTTY